MLRARLVPLGCLALSLYAGCGGDADEADETAQGGSASSGAGSGGGGGSGASASGGSGGGTSLGPTYTAAQACRLFAQATCNKGLECGLVLGQFTPTQLICVQCNATALGIIEQRCTEDSPGAKDEAAVDRCVANISAEPCARACSELSVTGCEVFGELDGGAAPVVCDPRCVG